MLLEVSLCRCIQNGLTVVSQAGTHIALIECFKKRLSHAYVLSIDALTVP